MSARKGLHQHGRISGGLTAKFVLFQFLLIFFTIATVSFLLITQSQKNLNDALLATGKYTAKDIAIVAAGLIVTDRIDDIGKIYGGLSNRYKNIVYISCLSNYLTDDLEVVYEKSFIPGLSPTHKDTHAVVEQCTNEKKTIVAFPDIKGHDIVEFATPLYYPFDKDYISHMNSLQDILLGYTTEEDYAKGDLVGILRIGMTLKDVNVTVKAMTQSMMITALCIFIVSIFLSIFLIRIVTSPIKKIVSATRKVAKGDLNTSVDVQSKDEVGELAQAFNQMIKDLKEYSKQIEQYSRALENKVEERTKELRETEVQLIQAAKMAAVGQLAAGVAHELNNPVGGIMGYAQFLQTVLDKHKTALGDDLYGKCIKYTQFIEKESHRCKHIVQNLLKFSRTSKTEFSSVDIKNVIQDTISVLQHQLDVGKVELVLNLPDGLPPVYGNANQLQQVFTNLIINARKAMHDGGTLTIEALFIDNSHLNRSSMVQMKFIDTGFGISEENLAKIFDPFFTSRQPGEGTGLGLAVSYGIIKDHHGDISVKSTVNKGTTFIITIPVYAGD